MSLIVKLVLIVDSWSDSSVAVSGSVSIFAWMSLSLQVGTAVAMWHRAAPSVCVSRTLWAAADKLSANSAELSANSAAHEAVARRRQLQLAVSRDMSELTVLCTAAKGGVHRGLLLVRGLCHGADIGLHFADSVKRVVHVVRLRL